MNGAGMSMSLGTFLIRPVSDRCHYAGASEAYSPLTLPAADYTRLRGEDLSKSLGQSELASGTCIIEGVVVTS